MMLNYRFCCIASVLIFLTITGANSLSCYDCHTGHPGCVDPFNNTNIPISNCSELFYSSRTDEYGVRATSTYRLTDDYSQASSSAEYECYAYHRQFPLNYTEVRRGCRIIDNNLCGQLANDTVGSAANVSSCYTCRENLCNEAQTINSVFMLVLPSLALTFIYNKF